MSNTTLFKVFDYQHADSTISVWVVAKEDEDRKKAEAARRQALVAEETRKRRAEIKRQSLEAET